MKKTKMKDLLVMNIEELTQKLKGMRMDLLKFRIESATTQVKNPLRKRSLRKDIARILTAIREKSNATKRA